jgi:hypothetical protein
VSCTRLQTSLQPYTDHERKTESYLALVAVSLLAGFVSSSSHRVALRPTLLIAVALIVIIIVAAPKGILSHLHHLQMPTVQYTGR